MFINGHQSTESSVTPNSSLSTRRNKSFDRAILCLNIESVVRNREEFSRKINSPNFIKPQIDLPSVNVTLHSPFTYSTTITNNYRSQAVKEKEEIAVREEEEEVDKEKKDQEEQSCNQAHKNIQAQEVFQRTSPKNSISNFILLNQSSGLTATSAAFSPPLPPLVSASSHHRLASSSASPLLSYQFATPLNNSITSSSSTPTLPSYSTSSSSSKSSSSPSLSGILTLGSPSKHLLMPTVSSLSSSSSSSTYINSNASLSQYASASHFAHPYSSSVTTSGNGLSVGISGISANSNGIYHNHSITGISHSQPQQQQSPSASVSVSSAQTEFDQYLSAFAFATTNTTNTTNTSGSAAIGGNNQSVLSQATNHYASNHPLLIDSYLTPSSHHHRSRLVSTAAAAAAAYSAAASIPAVGSSLDSRISPHHSFLKPSLVHHHPSTLFAPPPPPPPQSHSSNSTFGSVSTSINTYQSNIDRNNVVVVDEDDEESSINAAGSPRSPLTSSLGSPPTLTPLAALNPVFLPHPHHSHHHRQFTSPTSFSPTSLNTGISSLSNNLNNDNNNSTITTCNSSHDNSLGSASASANKSTFAADNCFASPSCLYYIGSHSASGNFGNAASIKRPFLNELAAYRSPQAKRHFAASTSASESSTSGDDSGFVSTGSPATDTPFPSPPSHLSPPQLISASGITAVSAATTSPSSVSSAKSSVASTLASVNNNNNNNISSSRSSSRSSPISITSHKQSMQSSTPLLASSTLSSSSSAAGITSPMNASPTLSSGQYGHLGDVSVATTAAASYSFDDYSSLPFSVVQSISSSPTSHQLSSASLPLGVNGGSGSGSVGIGIGGLSAPALSLKDIKLFSNYPSKSAITNAELRIIKQPETHHRARYMTEGSRGTIKDRTGRGYPVLQLIGYNKMPVKLQCFIGHDQKIGEPHLFYQACEVSGKTPYTFVKVDGFNTIELELLPKNNMQAVFDCMGILKERNVDVERKVLRNRRKSASAHNRPGAVNATEEAKMIRNTNKSRSTHCRMVFRLILPETGEILQTVSDPILCTQPLGSPEIYKMSLRECDLKGGSELFIIGKNFHKDSKVIFECQPTHWRKVIVPQKEFLNSTHLVCQVPPYDGLNAQCLPLVNVDVSVHCNHKNSDPMKFIYTNGFGASSMASNGTMNSQSSAAVAAAAAYASVCTLRETTTVVANPIVTGSNANALFLLERNDVLK